MLATLSAWAWIILFLPISHVICRRRSIPLLQSEVAHAVLLPMMLAEDLLPAHLLAVVVILYRIHPVPQVLVAIIRAVVPEVTPVGATPVRLEDPEVTRGNIDVIPLEIVLAEIIAMYSLNNGLIVEFETESVSTTK